jgi:hypothetical protein
MIPTTGQVVTDAQRPRKTPGLGWMAATLDGRVEGTGAVFDAKFMRSMRFWPCGAAGAMPAYPCARRLTDGFKRHWLSPDNVPGAFFVARI